MKQTRPNYEALDQTGKEYVRPARIVSELPTPETRMAACVEATDTVARLLGRPALKRIPFGMPVSTAFMKAPEVKNHPQKELLETLGCNLSLDLCATFA